MRRLFLITNLLFISFNCFAQHNMPVIYGTFETHSAKTYRIQVGAYSSQTNALNAMTQLQRLNLNPVRENFSCYSRVLLRGIPASQVVNTLTIIKRAGFNEVWIQQDTPPTTRRPPPAPVPTQGNTYYYGPSVSVITGLLTTQEVDMTEIYGRRAIDNIYVIILDNPINVIADINDDLCETVYNTSKIQLTGLDNFSAYIGMRVRLTGDFFYWHTGYHHTEVLMFVTGVTQVSTDRTLPPERAVYNIGGRGQAGGIVFYDKGSYSDGWRYIEAAPVDLILVQRYSNSEIIAGTSTGIGDGKRNTELIIAVHNRRGEDISPAQQCGAYTLNGYRGWFLPSKGELDLMYRNLKLRGLGNLNDGWYWSSSYGQNGSIWIQLFGSGIQNEYWSGSGCSVRAVRTF